MKKLILLFLLIVGWLAWRFQSTHHPDLPGYQTDASEIQSEQEKVYGQPLDSGEIEKGFSDARDHIHRAEYRAAITFFRFAIKAAALPIFYQDLGALYLARGDTAHAFCMFHLALDRDPAYRPAIDSLRALDKRMPSETAQVETEPNNTPELANDLAMNLPVSGEISVGVGDADVYAIIAPPGPRDLLEIEVENHAHFLAPRFRVLDSEGALFNRDVKAQPGESLKHVISVKPNTVLYLEVSGDHQTSGGYHLTVRPLQAFDSHEPNDTVFQATPLQLGKTAEANIMDGGDNDFYSFLPPASGSVTIDVSNRSTTLSLGLTMLGSDKSTLGFGPDAGMGHSVKIPLPVEGGHMYYVQVWSQGGTAGAYSITVTQP